MRKVKTKPEAPAPQLAAPAAMKISGTAKAHARLRPSRDAMGTPSAFVIPPKPKWVPTAAADMAQDSGFCDGLAFATTSRWSEGLGFFGYAYLAELSQRPEYRHISETIAKEMCRKWITLQATGEDDKSDRIKGLNAAMDRFKVQDAFRKAAELDGQFGRAQIYIDTGAEGDLLATPLVLDKRTIKRGSLRRLSVIEPMWTYPAGYNSSDPLDKNYYKPEFWYVMAKKVHVSRLLPFVGREMPDILKPAYMFGGLSLSQMAKPYVDNWLRTRQSVSDLIEAFSTMVLSTNMQATLAGGSGADLFGRVDIFNDTRNNRSTMLIDKETEALDNVSVPLGTLDKLQAQSQEQICSVAGIPMVKLLGITPSGLNASSEGELQVYYDSIHSMQERLFAHPLRTIIDIIQLSEFGDIDPDITFRFDPLWELDEAGKAAVRKMDADTDAVYCELGAIDAEDIRVRLATSEDSLYPGLDLSVPAPGPPEGEEDAPDGSGDPASGITSAGAKGSTTGANSSV